MQTELTDQERTLLTRRKFMLGAVFAASAGIAYARLPGTQIDHLGARKLEEVIPNVIGRWRFVTSSGLVIPPEDQLADALYSQLMTRVYLDGGEGSPVMFLVAQSAAQTGILQVHRPEVCYPTSGYRISDVIGHDVRTAAGTLRANALTATLNGLDEHILYWTRIGDRMPASWAEQRIAVAADNLRGIIPDAVLVRVSLVDNDRANAMRTLEQFVQTLVANLPQASRRVLFA